MKLRRALILSVLAVLLLAVGYCRHLRKSSEERNAELARQLRSSLVEGWGPPPDDLHVVARAPSGSLSEAVAVETGFYLLLDGKSIVRAEEGNPQTAPIYTAPRDRLLRSLKANSRDPAHIYFLSEERTSSDLDGAPPAGPDTAVGEITELDPLSGKTKLLFSLAQLKGTSRDFHPSGTGTVILTETENGQLRVHTAREEAGATTDKPLGAALGAWANLGPEALDHQHDRLIIAVQPAAAAPWKLVAISLQDGSTSEVAPSLGIAPIDLALGGRDGQFVILGGLDSKLAVCLFDPCHQPPLNHLKAIPVRWAPHAISSVVAGRAYFVSEIDESSAKTDPPKLGKVLWSVELPANP